MRNMVAGVDRLLQERNTIDVFLGVEAVAACCPGRCHRTVAPFPRPKGMGGDARHHADISNRKLNRIRHVVLSSGVVVRVPQAQFDFVY